MKEIVIKIPDEEFEHIKHGWIPCGAWRKRLLDAIKNGTPLPEDFSLEDYERYKKDSESLSWIKYPDRMGN